MTMNDIINHTVYFMNEYTKVSPVDRLTSIFTRVKTAWSKGTLETLLPVIFLYISCVICCVLKVECRVLEYLSFENSVLRVKIFFMGYESMVKAVVDIMSKGFNSLFLHGLGLIIILMCMGSFVLQSVNKVIFDGI